MKVNQNHIKGCVIVFLICILHALSASGDDAKKIFNELKWGRVETDSAPWISTSSFGWVYLADNSTVESFWVWIPRTGWLHSTLENFPTCYLIDPELPYCSEGYVLLDNTETRVIKYWNFSEQVWKFNYREDAALQLQASREYSYYLNQGLEVPEWMKEYFVLLFSYGSVPQNFVGLMAQNPIPDWADRSYQQIRILVGPYYLFYIVTGGFPEHWSFEKYFYNEHDGWFYGAERRNAQNSILPITRYDKLKIGVKDDNLVLETGSGIISEHQIQPILW